MDPPIDPDTKNLDRRPAEQGADQSEGMGAIVAVVAIAALIIVSLMYLLRPPSDVPSTTTSQAPGVTTSAPTK
jgi:hypothetical protein